MTAAGWSDCWVIVWCNTSDDDARARTALGAAVDQGRFEHLHRNGWAYFRKTVSDELVATATTAIGPLSGFAGIHCPQSLGFRRPCLRGCRKSSWVSQSGYLLIR